jgi:hypothetical protein
MPLDSIEVDSRFRLNALLGQRRWLRSSRFVYFVMCTHWPVLAYALL